MRCLGLVIYMMFLLQTKLLGQTVEPSRGVGAYQLQLEVETLYSVDKDNTAKITSWNLPNILMRYGLTNDIELQLHTPFTKERCFVNNKVTSNIFKFDEIEVGASFNLLDQKNWFPEAALMARVVLPTNGFGNQGIGNIISLNFSNTISKSFSLSYNLGTTTNTNKKTSGFYVMNMSYQINSQVQFFIENSSGFTFKNMESNCMATGFEVVMSPFCMIDFSVAKSLKNKMYYAGAILTWAINTKKSG